MNTAHMVDHLFLELGAILVGATILGLICHKLKQPLFLSYLLTGILVAALGLNSSTSPETLHFLSELGIAFLLFLVGLELNVSEIRRLGQVVTLTGLGQIAITGITGFTVAKIMGFDTMTCVYIGIALTFSSTIIVVKRLSDAHATQSVYGRVGLGVMLVQDVIALLALIVLSSIGTAGAGGLQLIDVALMLSKGATLVVASYVVSKYILPYVFRQLAGSAELLLLGSIGWCILLGAITVWAGFTIEIGAFLAGLALASSSYQYQISTRVRPLRDFFITIFFIVLGIGLSLQSLQQVIVPAMGLSLLVLVVNPLSVVFIMGRLGYKRHASFFTGLLTAQVGEFSLKLIVVGLALGHLSQSTVSMMTLVVVMTILASSYIALYQEKIYRRLKPILGAFEQEQVKSGRTNNAKRLQDHAILVGCSRLGLDILHAIQKTNTEVVVIDYDPEVIDILDRKNLTVMYGDVTDEEVLAEAGIERAKLVISTIDDHQSTLQLLDRHARVRQDDMFIVTATSIEEGLEFYRLGADYVIVPQLLSGQAVASLVEKHGQNKEQLGKLKLDHMTWLTHHHVVSRARLKV